MQFGLGNITVKQWSYLHEKVRAHIQEDKVKNRLENNAQCSEAGRRDIIIAICNALLARDIFTSLTDDAGGRLEKPLAFERHNPYSISFDRIDNEKAHFLSPYYLDNITSHNSQTSFAWTGLSPCIEVRRLPFSYSRAGACTAVFTPPPSFHSL